MFYIIGINSEIDGNITSYKLVDTLSESIWELTPNQLKYIIKSPFIHIANATIRNGNIQVKSWIAKIATESPRPNIIALVNSDKIIDNKKSPFILLAEDKEEYRIVHYNGHITKISLNKLAELVNLNEIANCSIVQNDGIIAINWHKKYKIIIDGAFKRLIANKYEAFISKALLLGYGKISFEYEIENTQVKLKSYTGSSKNIILPSFITVVMTGAFRGVTIETLNLNEGLNIIWAWAFSPHTLSKTLESVEIPSTVELIGHGAFANNNNVYRSDSSITMNKLKMRNEKTIVLDLF